MSGALTVVFVAPRTMKKINGRYRSRDYATDVLSFAYGNETEGDVRYLGDIVISPEVAALNAERWRTSSEKEVRRLLVHGILHLLGYNHETDAGEMRRLQAHLLRRKYFIGAAPVLSG